MINLNVEHLMYMLSGLGYYDGDQYSTANEFLLLYDIRLRSNEDDTYTLVFYTAKEELMFRLRYAELLVY